MKKGIMICICLLIAMISGCSTPPEPEKVEPVITHVPNYDSKVSGVNVSIESFKNAEDTDYTEAIMRAHAYLKAEGGGTLVFPEGAYLIKPSKIFIPSNISWLGEGVARLYTEEKQVYNVLISTETGAKNIGIYNIVFDQRTDGKLTPDINGLGGCFILHISNTDEITVEGCTFYTYGVCAILAQSNDDYPTNNIRINNNKAYFQRKVDKFYDVSVFNIDGKHMEAKGNYVESVFEGKNAHWKARCAYEIHTPDGNMENNDAINCEVGIIHLEWPALWATYDPQFKGTINMSTNRIKGAIIGISMWGASTVEGVITKNLNIRNNSINLHLDKLYVPSQGIAFINGSIGNSQFKHITVDGNEIFMTTDEAIKDINKKMDSLIPGEDVGAIICNTNNAIDGMIISNNTVKGFPFAFLNLYKRSASNDLDVHKNVQVINNTVTDCAYVQTYDDTFEAIFNFGRINNLKINGNQIVKKYRKPVDIYNRLDNITNLDMTNNNYIEELM